MHQSKAEKRIRDLWLQLPECRRHRMLDILVFRNDIAANYPELLVGIEGDLTEYLKIVLNGLYKTNGFEQVEDASAHKFIEPAKESED
jgi:hypothetical protein